MTESISLRKLNLKSVLDFTKYHGWSIQKMIDEKRFATLGYVYYNYEKFSYTEEVMQLLPKWIQENQISKPGVDKELYVSLTATYKNNNDFLKNATLEKINSVMIAQRLQKGFVEAKVLDAYKRKKMRIQSRIDPVFTKRTLQGQNHGR